MTYKQELEALKFERGREFYELWKEKGWSHRQIAAQQEPPITRARVGQVIQQYLRHVTHPNSQPQGE